VQYYQKLGVYHQVDGMRPIDEVTRDILSIVDAKKKSPTPVTRGGN
jgi:hypothetical protein